MTLPDIDKPTVVEALRAGLEDELRSVEAMAEMARDEATNSETKAEGKYDTRATEASYLARGQAWRIAELRKLCAWLGTDRATAPLSEATVQTGALVRVCGARSEWVYIAPIGGGKANIDGQTVRLISLASPLGSAMEGLEAEDGFEVDTPGGTKDYEITDIL
jgi:transcription elongation GreA/GreB family factor